MSKQLLTGRLYEFQLSRSVVTAHYSAMVRPERGGPSVYEVFSSGRLLHLDPAKVLEIRDIDEPAVVWRRSRLRPIAPWGVAAASAALLAADILRQVL